MGFLSRIGTDASRSVEEIFPFAHYAWYKKRKLRELKVKDILSHESFAGYTSLTESYLSERLKEERQRAAAMDEKTFKMTLSLSFGLTVLGASATFLLKQISTFELRFTLAAMISIGLFYVLAAGFIALGALRTMPSYGYGTDVAASHSGNRVKSLADSLARQETINIVRHLRNEAAYQSLRNGLVMLFVAIGLFALALAFEALFPSTVPLEIMVALSAA